MAGDFSIVNNLNANEAELQLGRNQEKLKGTAQRLSSGLRINTASDDPSGLAISENLLTRVQALTQSSQNVNTARNALAVADGAMATITNILMRIRSIAVEAASSIDSDTDRANLQDEVDSLVSEINRISQNTNFNGQALLDGSHAGFQSAVPATAVVTANTVLATAGANASATAPSRLLLATLAVNHISAFAPTFTELLQPAVATTAPQTLKVSNTVSLAPGQVLASGNSIAKILAVDPTNGTITATFTNPVAVNKVLSGSVQTSSVSAVPAGLQIMTLATASPLYAGEALQINPNTFATNDVVVVQKVLSPTSFLATFSKPQPAGVGVYNGNDLLYSGGGIPGQTVVISFGGAPADPPPVGSPAYVVEQAQNAYNPTSGRVQVVQTGTVTKVTPTSETVVLKGPVPNLFGGFFQVFTNAGNGNAPLTTTVDGTIKLQVVNTGVSIAVQETFYATASQTSYTSAFLLSPNESAMLLDGVTTTTGNFTAADVGTSAYIKVQQATAAVTNPSAPALTIHSGGDEGASVKIAIPSVSAESLRVSTLSVQAPAGGGDPTLAAQDTIGQVDFALARVLSIRAGLGAQIVSLTQDANNDDIGAIGLQASESSIRDADIPADTAAFALEQVDVQVGLSVLSQVNNLPEQVLKLFR